jgi:hypothetical protein
VEVGAWNRWWWRSRLDLRDGFSQLADCNGVLCSSCITRRQTNRQESSYESSAVWNWNRSHTGGIEAYGMLIDLEKKLSGIEIVCRFNDGGSAQSRQVQLCSTPWRNFGIQVIMSSSYVRESYPGGVIWIGCATWTGASTEEFTTRISAIFAEWESQVRQFKLCCAERACQKWQLLHLAQWVHHRSGSQQ